MKITICNSVHFWEKAKEAQEKLNSLGHEALTHPMELELDGKMVPVIEYYKLRKATWNESIEDLKEWAMREHFDKIMGSDAILVLNHEKDGRPNYIGGNTFLEIGLAFALKKKVFFENPIPEQLSYAEELKGMRPVIVGDDYSMIR